MRLQQITSMVDGIPHTTAQKGAVLYRTVTQNSFSRCLELGFACGVGSSYIAAALAEQKNGHLTSVDLPLARNRKPTAPDLLKRVGLDGRVDFVFHDLGYNWFLMDAIEKGQTFDFCFLDGAHTWDVDALAFFLLDRVLEPGGIIIFDDLDWTYASSPTMRDKPVAEQMRTTAGVRKIVELLVKSHPHYDWISETVGLGITRRRQPRDGLSELT